MSPEQRSAMENALDAMTRMTDQQQEYVIKWLEKMVMDPAFAVRGIRESVIFVSLMKVQNFAALDRWFARKSLELVARNGRRI